MTEEKLKFVDDKLFVYTPLRPYGDGMCKVQLVMTKEIFQECYKKWIEPKIGHWTRELIRNEKGGCIGAKMICSEGDNDNKHDEYMNYCPNCGAKMVER